LDDKINAEDYGEMSENLKITLEIPRAKITKYGLSYIEKTELTL
tara:strand:- start:2019 stop:2150 length:132 start_codon:yes stop_codon:yes gene_type:complete